MLWAVFAFYEARAHKSSYDRPCLTVAQLKAFSDLWHSNVAPIRVTPDKVKTGAFGCAYFARAKELKRQDVMRALNLRQIFPLDSTRGKPYTLEQARPQIRMNPGEGPTKWAFSFFSPRRI